MVGFGIIAILAVILIAANAGNDKKTPEAVIQDESVFQENNQGSGRNRLPAGLISVKGGTFQMGCTSDNSGDCETDELPLHTASVSDFLISATEVTQAEWVSIMGYNNSSFTGPDMPVENVSWFDAINYCNKRSLSEGLDPVYINSNGRITADIGRNGYRLPTEAEWEYAARGGNKSRGFFYSGSNSSGEIAWYEKNSAGETHPVGKRKPNELGLYDMSGNVREWCWDWYSPSYDPYSTLNNSSNTNIYRVSRGGSWNNGSYFLRVSHRGDFYPVTRVDYIGLRVVRSY
ncbi:MAG: SUMF1/EgtB/PvdO family nonheme iron enzyme [Ignavibacteriaceae bacterium]|nr:SUMF1/EgtB/PvdO family nonheme iron enzyme [Ignavibacteriaceae bacterium]